MMRSRRRTGKRGPPPPARVQSAARQTGPPLRRTKLLVEPCHPAELCHPAERFPRPHQERWEAELLSWGPPRDFVASLQAAQHPSHQGGRGAGGRSGRGGRGGKRLDLDPATGNFRTIETGNLDCFCPKGTVDLTAKAIVAEKVEVDFKADLKKKIDEITKPPGTVRE